MADQGAYARIALNDASVPFIEHASAPPEYYSGVPVCEISTLLTRVRDRRVTPRIHEYMVQGWYFTKDNICTFLGIELLMTLLMIIRGLIIPSTAYWDTKPDADGSNMLISMFVTGIVDTLVITPLGAGITRAVLNGMRRGGQVYFGDIFWVFTCPYYFSFLRLTTLVFLATQVLLLLFLIPGIIFSVLTAFIVVIHQEAEGTLGVMDTIQASSKLVCRYYCPIFLISLYSIVVIVLGLFFFVVGAYVAIPVVLCAHLFFYRHAVGVNGLPLDDSETDGLRPVQTALHV